MAQPASRQELIDYALRQNGAPVLEINVAEEQLQDLTDDAIQYYQERHYDGITKVFLKYKVTQEDIDRGKVKIQLKVDKLALLPQLLLLLLLVYQQVLITMKTVITYNFHLT